MALTAQQQKFKEAVRYCWAVAKRYPKGQQKQVFAQCMREYLRK